MSDRTNQKKPKSGIGKILLIILSVVVVLTAVVYITGVIYFRNHFFYRTNVGSTDVSFKNVDDTISTLNDAVNVYKIKITAPDTTYEVKGKDISLKLDSSTKQAIEDDIASQNVFIWPITLFQPQNKDIRVDYSESELKEKLSDLLTLDKDPVNATIAIDGNNYKVVKEKYGADTAAVEKEIDEAINKQEYSLTLNTANFTEPQITTTSDEITNATKTIDSYLKGIVSYTIGSSKEVTEKGSILNLLDISDTYEVTLNDDKLLAYVDELAAKFNTYGKVRKFTTQAGDEIEIGGGDYGYILDKDAEFAQLKQDLVGGKTVERQPAWSQTANGTLDNDIGDRYVELDYTNQVMYYILNGQQVFSTDIVSGNNTVGQGSPDGIFRIKYRVKDTHLKGKNLDGTDYDSPVNYFIVFAYDVGFHDAPWQPWFGGNRYLYAGSHGCINLSNSAAQYTYENIPDDLPVVAYYRTPTTLVGTANRNSNAFSYRG